MQTFVLICDLKDEPEAIEAYVDCHREVAPEILESIRVAGILKMSIYRWKNRLTMIIQATDQFSFEQKAKLDQSNPKVQEWEKFLGQFQTNLPGTPPNWRWALIEQIFEFKAD
ncbi:L-rhamnose mutarotase [Algoriphagus hitonicola]|uniref:L-rhamnose mutarotase n=1 Tax=Algoriphagus hitonicola TaxID=435880 RepID=A0A1I2T8E7_9BACT|nr:L-rhamnose mutarotase [Algoriphagus hitonicola]SFG61070.1 L-rhamnose mutarotase [Algoriphagus hitonicola]